MILSKILFPSLMLLLLGSYSAGAQQITGFWKGKINNKKVEVKIIQKGDSLTGTSYYYESSGAYRRYSIKGYFDQQKNSVVWWDDQLIGDKGLASGKNPQLSVADFNCPGGGEMYLDGKTGPRDKQTTNGSLNLTKVPDPSFRDEWDYVIDNYTVGGNDPELIDSVEMISLTPKVKPEPPVVVSRPAPLPEKKPDMVVIPSPPVQEPLPQPALTIEEKFIRREKIFTKEIQVAGDSIELRFYDNAQVDGDSISLFLNNRLLFTHIRLTDKAYTIKLSVSELQSSNELIMVAENLGSIPPNTSYMVAVVGDKRYDAQLASTENSSAMIRLTKN